MVAPRGSRCVFQLFVAFQRGELGILKYVGFPVLAPFALLASLALIALLALLALLPWRFTLLAFLLKLL